ncbi:MAG: hypothetical protein IJB44_03715, partial [Clostridia bacterium]|nr:hypothetical protein [Clostridia bacterium]
DVTLPSVFTTVTYSTSITKEVIEQVNNDQIIVWAYAHQSAGGVTQDTADTAAKAWYKTATVTTTP